MQIKRLPLLLVFMIFLFLIPNQNSTSSSSYTEITVPNDFDFEPIGEARIFGTVPFDVNQTYAQTLASNLFQLTGLVSEDEDGIRIENGSETFEMYTACGSIWYADESKLWNVTYSPDLPTLTESKDLTDKFITSNSYFAPTQLSYFGSTNASGYNVVTHEMQEKILNINVNYGFMLDGLRLGGPGATSSVSLGDKGEIIGVNWIKRETTPLHYEPLYSVQDILTLHGITNYVSYEHELVYFHDEVGVNQEYIYPVYEIELEQLIDDQEFSAVMCLPATSFNPVVKITSPSDGKTVSYGDMLDFNCSVTFGTSPYSYTWESDIDGILSNSATFQKNDLSSAIKGNDSVAHAITLNITDSHGLTTENIITIEITPSSSAFIGIEYIVIIGFLGITFYLFISKSKDRKHKSFVTILSLVSLITMSTLTQLSTVTASVNTVIYEIPSDAIAVDDDNHGIFEIGAEYVGKYSYQSDLPNADNVAKRFCKKLGKSSVWNKEFIYGNALAWEEDFKRAAANNGGMDDYFIDAVDIAYYRGHGHPGGFTFEAHKDDQGLVDHEAEWGNGDLEWLMLDTCSVLQFDSDWGNNVFERWGPRLRGLHMICGFSTFGTDSASRGAKFAKQAMKSHTVKYSWFKACKQTTSRKRWAAILYASNSDDPWHPQQDDPHNDHLHGYGYVCSDPYPAKWWVWISSQC